jgi:hypothetical protein
MWHVWGIREISLIREIHKGFWRRNVKERDHWEGLGMEERIIL